MSEETRDELDAVLTELEAKLDKWEPGEKPATKPSVILTLPPKPPKVGSAYAGDCPDWIQKLGDQIAELSIVEAVELKDYLEHE